MKPMVVMVSTANGRMSDLEIGKEISLEQEKISSYTESRTTSQKICSVSKATTRSGSAEKSRIKSMLTVAAETTRFTVVTRPSETHTSTVTQARIPSALTGTVRTVRMTR